MKNKKIIYYVTSCVIATLPFAISMFVNITENQSNMLLFTIVVLLLIIHIPIISKFEAWGVSVELKQQLQEAQVTIKHLNETLRPLVEELYAHATNQGRYIDVKTDDTNTPLAELAKQLNIYDSEEIKKWRLRMYKLGINDAFNNISTLPITADNYDEIRLKDGCIQKTNIFKAKYKGNLIDYPTNKDIDAFYSTISNNKFMDLDSLQRYKEVQIHQQNLIDSL